MSSNLFLHVGWFLNLQRLLCGFQLLDNWKPQLHGSLRPPAMRVALRNSPKEALNGITANTDSRWAWFIAFLDAKPLFYSGLAYVLPNLYQNTFGK